MAYPRKNWIRVGVLSVVLAAAGGLGIAAAKSNDRHYGGCGARHGGHMPGMFAPGRHVEGKLAFLKTELGITEEQEQSWQVFADVMRESEQARADRHEAYRERYRARRNNGHAREPMPLDQRIDRRLEMMERRTAEMRKLGEAAKALYSALTPAQQETADAILPPRYGRHSRHY